jgi:hypothetical protein
MLDPNSEQARRWAVEELSHREYQQARPGLVTRALAWLLDQVQRWLDALPAGSTAWWALGLGLLLAVVAGVVGYAIWRAGGLGSVTGSGAAGSVFGEAATRTAAEHRAASAAAEAGNDWELAVLERFRAIARELEERTVLAARPGRTAGEVAQEAGAVLGGLREGLHQAARVFDAVRYGGRAATAEHVERLRAVDAEVLAGATLPAPPGVPA